jgi:hypothetical protein
MNVKETREYEMLLGVRAFGHTHRELLGPSTAAPALFARVAAAIDELAATDVLRLSAAARARADRKAAARKRLLAMLTNVRRLANVLRRRGRITAPFSLPRSRHDQTLLTVGRQFARDAADVAAECAAHGLVPARIAHVTTQFEQAIDECRMGDAEGAAARARIRELLADARLDVQALDVIVDNELGREHGLCAAWKQARHIERCRSRRGATVDAAAAGPAPVTAPAAAPVAPHNVRAFPPLTLVA